MQHLFRHQSEGDGSAETPNRRRGQALVGLVAGGTEAPGSATTTPLVNLVIGQRISEKLLERSASLPGNARQNIHPELTFPAVAVAEFERIVLNERSRVIDVSVLGNHPKPSLGRQEGTRPPTGQGAMHAKC